MKEYKLIDLGTYNNREFSLPDAERLDKEQGMDLKDMADFFKDLSKEGWDLHSINEIYNGLSILGVFVRDVEK